jgi:hypothetical protein
LGQWPDFGGPIAPHPATAKRRAPDSLSILDLNSQKKGRKSKPIKDVPST